MHVYKSLLLAALAVILSACAEAPTGPTVAVMPAPGKPMDLFEQEDGYCRNYAQYQIGGAQNPNNKVAEGAAVGTAVGAVAGAVLSGGRAGGVAAGAGTGLLFGTAAGGNAAQQSGMSLQRRYDIAYTQCMYSKGNQIPAYGYSRYAYPPPPNYAYPSYGYPPPSAPASGSTPPPPPAGAPPPPPPDATPPVGS